MTTVLDTSVVSRRERFQLYREAVSRTFVPLNAGGCPCPDDFRATIASCPVGAIQVTSVEATPHWVVRSPSAVQHAVRPYYKLALQVSGHASLTQDDRDAVLAPGDFAIYDTTRPYTLRFWDDYRTLVALIPQALVRTPSNVVANFTARTVDGGRGIGRTLAPFLAELDPTRSELSDAVASHLGSALLELLSAWFASDTTGAAPRSRREALAARVTEYIDQRLGDPALDCASIAKAHHISVSYLQKIFAAESVSVAAMIRERRLDRCRADLLDPNLVERSASAIAARWGMPDASYFSRLFKSSFGVTPGEYRTHLLSRGAADAVA